ncbi:family 43 glycosylhydrolase [Pedobacter sp. GSP4]|uniref:family 43 glycosylhydrolase n=1 Tax=Pedobacter sp. GSP4 TaxID=3453716 RepID=UPI003EEA85C8
MMKRFLAITLMTLCLGSVLFAQQIKNFTPDGKQITRFDQMGKAVDAHDGEIAYFGGTYYLYGTSYDCGFEWNNKTAPFCGFKTYSSKDMQNWKDEGYLFDAKTPLWQSRCDGKTYGCFRPHVIFNKKANLYVLWINVYDNVSGYRVFTSKSPIGPFIEKPEPKISVNSDMPAAGLNNGDHDLFIDDDGRGYLAFTDWRTKGTIVIEQLTDDYLTGTGRVVKSITTGQTEAPALFKRNGIYYLTYSDPNCGYCSGTGTSYRTAKSVFGPWSEGRKISDNSCGGQPSFVSTMKINAETVYLYGSDLWNNAAKNEALANFYWAPLTFAADGSINPLECLKTFALKKGNAEPAGLKEDYLASCDINAGLSRSQSFRSAKSGLLKSVDITTLKSGYPDQDLIVAFYPAVAGKISGAALGNVVVSEKLIGWSAKQINIKTAIAVQKQHEYIMVIKSGATTGCYGFAMGKAAVQSADVTAVSKDKGATFEAMPGNRLKVNFNVE